MNNFFGIITTSLIVCAFAGPAWSGLTESEVASDGTSGQGLSAPGSGGGQAAIDSFLDRFPNIGFSDTSVRANHSSSHATVSLISENTLLSTFSRVDSPMNAYYSRSGSDNKEIIAAVSSSEAFPDSQGGERFAPSDAGLAAVVHGYFVGSGAMVDGAGIAPIQATSSWPIAIQNTTGKSGFYDVTITTTITTDNGQTPVPLPLPFLLTGSGLITLLALRKRPGTADE